jgi:hypothetical protein
MVNPDNTHQESNVERELLDLKWWGGRWEQDGRHCWRIVMATTQSSPPDDRDN